MKNSKKLNVDKSNLLEATIKALQGTLKLEENKTIKTEDVEVETSDVEVCVANTTTTIESDEATITIEKNCNENSSEEVVELPEENEEVVEIPVESDETIIPEEVVELPEENEEVVPNIDEMIDNEPQENEDSIESDDIEKNEEEDKIVEESKEVVEEDLTDKKFEVEGTYWNGDGKYQSDVELLNKLIPAQGTEPVIEGVLPDKIVNDYITLSNKYYRWFNDGDVPFKKLLDGTVIYPSYTKGDRLKTTLGQKTYNSICFDLENRVNSLIENINKKYPDWKEKLNNENKEDSEEINENKEIKEDETLEEDYSQRIGGDPEDYIIDLRYLLREIKTIETENLTTGLAKEIVTDFEDKLESQIRQTIYKYELDSIYNEDGTKKEATNEQAVVESKKEKSLCEESFQKVIEGFYKERYKTLKEVKIDNIEINENNIKIESTLTNKFNKNRIICLEGKCIQKGKSFMKYNIKESTGLKLESNNTTNLSLLTFTNKNNILECKYLKTKTAKKAE